MGFRWIKNRRLKKEEATGGLMAGLFPPGRACDYPEKFQSWYGTDVHNITGIADFLKAAERFDDPAQAEIRAVRDDYLAAWRKVIMTFKDTGWDITGWKTPIPGYVLGLSVRFGFFGEQEVMSYWNACLKRGSVTERGLCANFPPRKDPSPHYWYTTSQDVFWHRAFRKFGRHDLADRILSAMIHYAMTAEFCVGERYCDSDPWFLPWAPNASGSGRIIQMLYDAER